MRLGSAVRFVIGLFIFTLATPAISPGQTAGKEDVFIVERGAHHKIVQRVSWVTNDAGAVTARTNSYTELATGMHYQEGEQWRESEAKIELLPNNAGAMASKGQHKAIFPPEIKSGLIELQTPDQQWLRSRVTGLSYFDEATGKSVLLASVQTSAGQLAGDNSVVYPNAFAELLADIRYTYSLAGFEQDVVLREQPPSPEKFGLNPKTTRLQVLTEFVEAPAPAKTSREIAGLTDQTLGFGEMMSIGAGKAFSVDAAGDTTGQVPVAKSWTPLGGRNFLIEEVRYEEVADQLQKLPIATKYKGAGLRRRGTGENVIAGLKKLLPKRYAKAAPKPGKQQMAQATPQTQPSFVMDYVILNTSQNNYIFKGDSTYYVSGAVLLSGTTIFEGGAVLKYAVNKTLNINPPGIAKTTATAYRPVIFTAKDDNTVGDIISGSSGNPLPNVYYANPALTLRTPGNPALQYFRFAYAQQAVSVGWGLTLNLAHAQFVNCNYGVAAGYYQSLNLNLKNVLFAHVQTPFDLYTLGGGATITAQQVTFDSSSTLVRELSSAYVLYLTNCILANVTNTGWAGLPDGHLFGNHNGSYNITWYGSSLDVTSTVNPFQAVGAGSYYLTNGCNFIDAGTTAIDPVLVADLGKKTTVPPVVYSNTAITDIAIYGPQAGRDADTPDLGYHYDPVDYFFAGVNVSTNITFTDGTVMGWFELPVANHVPAYGIGLLQNGVVSFDGSSCEPCKVVRYDTVQEGGNGVWKDKGTLAAISGTGSSVVNASFTHFAALAGDPDHFRDYGDAFNVSATHCEFWGGGVGGYFSVYNLNNCLFERSRLKFESDYWSTDRSMAMQNCTMRGGTLEIQNYWDTTVWTVNVLDCAFDATVIDIGYSFSTDSIINCDYNAYLSGAGQLPFGSNNRVVSTFDWQRGSLGSFYLPVTSDLINNGSDSSINLGLATFTTQTSQAADLDTVDIGYHYRQIGKGNLIVSTNVTKEGLARMLVPSWVTVSNVKFTGEQMACGIFCNGCAAGLPINGGVILSSGDIELAVGPNNTTEAGVVNIALNDTDLDRLVSLVGGAWTTNAAVLEFDMVSTNSFPLRFHYIFASEEYSEYIGSPPDGFNDPMAIYVSTNYFGNEWIITIEDNIALVPGTNQPVTVNTVNGGGDNILSGSYVPPSNQQYYLDNKTPRYGTSKYNIQYDGMTVLLMAPIYIEANTTNHVKIGIEDFGDAILDSAVFIKAWSPCD